MEKRFEDMQVWRDAHELTMRIYQLTKSFPEAEMQYPHGIAHLLKDTALTVSGKIAFASAFDEDEEQAEWLLVPLKASRQLTVYLQKARPFLPLEVYEELIDANNHVQRQLEALTLE
jgi:hypothetical protein